MRETNEREEKKVCLLLDRTARIAGALLCLVRIEKIRIGIGVRQLLV